MLLLMQMLTKKSFSQELSSPQNLPLNSIYQVPQDIFIHSDTETVQHLGFLPLLSSRVKYQGPLLKFTNSDRKSWFARKSFDEHWIQYDSNSIYLSIDPVVDFEFGKNLSQDAREDVSLYKNVRGFMLRLNLGSKIAVSSTFRENQVVLPNYLHRRTRINRVAYGQGRIKQFNDDGFDFAMASSNISYSPNERFNIQFGHGKHFVGYGMRSHLLSDLAFNYPYLRLNSNWFDGKLNYQNLYTYFQEIERLQNNALTEGLFRRKQGSFHFLDFAPTKKLNIGIFEGLMWTSLDTSGRRQMPINYYLPLAFLNTILEGEEQKGNSLLGFNAQYQVLKYAQLYTQIAMDGVSFKSRGFQAGLNVWLKKLPLKFSAEYNSSTVLDFQNQFSHYNESLGSPVQQGGEEFLLRALIHKKRWVSLIQGNQISYKTGKIQYAEFRQSYIINTSSQLSFHAGIRYRIEEHASNKLNMVYFGLSTNLQNIYLNY